MWDKINGPGFFHPQGFRQTEAYRQQDRQMEMQAAPQVCNPAWPLQLTHISHSWLWPVSVEGGNNVLGEKDLTKTKETFQTRGQL